MENFMTGHRIVFNREKFVLGWKQFNCSDIEDSSTPPMNPRNTTTAVSPSPAMVPSSYDPAATEKTRNGSPVSELPRTPVINHASRSHSYFTYTFLMLFLLLSAIL